MRVMPPPSAAHDSASKRPHRRRGGRIWLVVFIVIVAAVAGTAYAASAYFSKATFTIVPVEADASLSGITIVANGTSTPGTLRYEVIRETGVATTSVPATDGAYISTKSSGTVILYNSYQKAPQRLIAGTRLSSDPGLVYRLTGSVSVPGYSTAGGTVIPGSIRATVVADQAGDQYNLSRNAGANGLHVIAYSGSDRYGAIYAKLSSDITGGFTGTRKTVEPSLIATTTQTLQASLAKSLRDKALTGVPAGYVMYQSAYATAFDPASIGGSAKGSATISVSGTLYGITFKKTDLAAKLVGPQKIAVFQGSPFQASGIESLTFAITNPDTFSPARLTALIAKVSGNVKLTGVIPVDEIRRKLAGLSLPATRDVFASYSSVVDISKSSGELFPSWASGVPNDPSRISVQVRD